MKRLAHAWRVNRGLLVLLGIVAGTGVIHFFVLNQRAFLNFYYLPVVFGAYALGLRRGVLAALLSLVIVYAIALMNDQQFAGAVADGWMRWLDLGTWGCFLVLTAYVVGTLYELKERQIHEIRAAYQGILEITTQLIDSVDRHMREHSRRVSDSSVSVARALGLGDVDVEDIRVGAWLHDIGKADVSMEVLRKAAGLTPKEMAEMHRRVYTEERLTRSRGGILRRVIPMIACQQERWDGAGFRGIKGEEIPLGARIIAVTNTYDAIVTDRPYRKGKKHDEAMEIIRQGRGKQFDPLIVDVFMRLDARGASHRPELMAA